MVFKRANVGYASFVKRSRESSDTQIGRNGYPRLWGGASLTQLAILQRFLAAAVEHRINGVRGTVAPSNLAEVRARLKARKPKIG